MHTCNTHSRLTHTTPSIQPPPRHQDEHTKSVSNQPIDIFKLFAAALRHATKKHATTTKSL